LKGINKKYREEINQNIDHELDNQDFRSLCRDTDSDGVCRNRIFTVRTLILFILSLKTSIQRDLDSFFGQLNDADFNIRAVSKGAFSRARAKLNPEAFKRLNEVVCNTFYEKSQYYTWFGYRVLSVDGTRLLLPKHESIQEKFGTYMFGPKADSEQSMALGSVLYDVFNQVNLDAEIACYSSSESSLLVKHLSKCKEGDLLLLDRGYPSFWLLTLLIAKKLDFCVRLKANGWNVVNEFQNSDDIERIVKLKAPKSDDDKLAEYAHYQGKEIEVRLIKVLLNTGEIEVLCTSLLDTEKYEKEAFGQLYHFRWNQEENYKLLKARMEVERFTGKTATAVMQDFYAKLFTMSLMASYAHPIEAKVIAEHKADEENRQYDQKINRTYALAQTRGILVAIFIKKQFKKALNAFDELVYKTRELVRKARKNPIKKKPKRPYHMNYKVL
jgi:hypothetical protein